MSKFTLEITPSVRAVLERCTTKDNELFLPKETLPNYREIDARLRAAGFLWNKKSKSHVTTGDAKQHLQAMLHAGAVTDEAKKKKVTRQAFYTPAGAAQMVAMLAVVEGESVLEPSAGHGALALACMDAGARSVQCIEQDPEACEHLRTLGRHVTVMHEGDFLDLVNPHHAPRFSRIVMNPPFTRGTDIKHVLHAYEHWLAPKGRLVSIIGSGATYRKKLPAYQVIHRFEAGTFKESGTNIATDVILLTRHA